MKQFLLWVEVAAILAALMAMLVAVLANWNGDRAVMSAQFTKAAFWVLVAIYLRLCQWGKTP